MICVSTGKTGYSELIGLLDREELVEIRLDLNSFTDTELVELSSSPALVIATCRPGKFTDTERTRKLKLCAESGASYIDFELESGEEAVRDISDFVSPLGTKLILSHHNFDMTPPRDELERIYRSCAEMGADIVKIACNSSSEEDNARLLSLYQRAGSHELPPLISIGMGDAGRITRAAALFLGAPFTYASAAEGEETAPGQFTKDLIEEIILLITNGIH